MPLTADTVRAQLMKRKETLASISLEGMRKGQNIVGEFMEHKYRKQIITKEHKFENFNAAWVIPKEERRR